MASPLLALAVPACLVVCLATRVDPVKATRGIGQVVKALGGTRFTLENEHGALLISVS
ncbi:hypothetical protein ACIBBD_35290 [Streptomyces sp. NPDC051315]|uniref:hypothetical protein n=1 Tax=Streptomyces sp. NPDC051315 TaxID=3365650 RepID=UPI0037BD225F